ncbi:glucocorticoid modulatory element-binding protein 1-like [Sinocyclocheilus rhinocerous]|uniref:glucocorticoid modulatory element-binding protein 1-like n=1 Tax=Sinocyclocheilus rhinocerous TaxID=307959 RepID=UPI0007B9B4EC|nr:PREDICTED: glucocorticoid modulatory element-binding protein 1-like [Sinocyclocheilus rhinocerous]
MVEWSTATVESPEKRDSTEISDETLSFWRGITEVGLMGEVVSNIHSELLSLLRGVQLRTDQSSLQDAEIAVLSNLAQVFDLLDSIKQILNVRRQMTDPEQTQVLRTLTSESRDRRDVFRPELLSTLKRFPNSVKTHSLKHKCHLTQVTCLYGNTLF